MQVTNCKTKEIVFISSISWDFSWHRQQEIMSKLAENGWKILYVQPVNKRKMFLHEVTQVNEHIWLISVPGLPYERCLRIINFINGKISDLCIQIACKKIGFHGPLVWLDRLHGFNHNCKFTKNGVIYDLIDEITAFGRYCNKKMLLSIENNVLKNADLLISSSQTLLERKITQSGRSTDMDNIFIPNGVDVERFLNSQPDTYISKIPYPRIGFIGDISRRSLNVDLILDIASCHPEWNFVFVGPCHADFKNELVRDNIHIFEPVSGERVPNVVEAFDVGIIPYNVEKEDMDYVFPRKACEYLAAGKPVVSTALNEIKILQPWVLVAKDISEFDKLIKIALIQTNCLERKNYVKQYDWEILLENLQSRLEKI